MNTGVWFTLAATNAPGGANQGEDMTEQITPLAPVEVRDMDHAIAIFRGWAAASAKAWSGAIPLSRAIKAAGLTNSQFYGVLSGKVRPTQGIAPRFLLLFGVDAAKAEWLISALPQGWPVGRRPQVRARRANKPAGAPPVIPGVASRRGDAIRRASYGTTTAAELDRALDTLASMMIAAEVLEVRAVLSADGERVRFSITRREVSEIEK